MKKFFYFQLIIIMIICPVNTFSQTENAKGLAVLDLDAIGISETEAKEARSLKLF